MNGELFEENNMGLNLLPRDGEVVYRNGLLTIQQADLYLATLLNTLAWRNDEATIYGRHIITKRKVAWYGDSDFAYTYSNATRHALPWTRELLELKEITEAATGVVFNSCLLNLYHNGDEGMAWHSDDETALLKNGTIASLSLGAGRRFLFRHKQSKETIEIHLAHGSLLEMKGETQTYWRHSLPKSKKVSGPRVNLTFRIMVPQSP